LFNQFLNKEKREEKSDGKRRGKLFFIFVFVLDGETPQRVILEKF
jgi:hypothetical protein